MKVVGDGPEAESNRSHEIGGVRVGPILLSKEGRPTRKSLPPSLHLGEVSFSQTELIQNLLSRDKRLERLTYEGRPRIRGTRSGGASPFQRLSQVLPLGEAKAPEGPQDQVLLVLLIRRELTQPNSAKLVREASSTLLGP